MKLSRIFCLLVLCAFTFTPAFAAKTYKFKVSRINQDFYKVPSRVILIRTQFCQEPAIEEDVVLHIDNQFGVVVGKLIFLRTNKICEVIRFGGTGGNG